MASQNIQSDVFRFVSLRPPVPPSRDAASNSFTYDDRTARETPVGKFLAQFTADNVSTLKDKLTGFIAQQAYDLGFPQITGDNTLDLALAAAQGLASDKISTQALVTAIQTSTGQTIGAL